MTSLPKTSHPTGLHFMRRNPNPKKEDHGDCGVRAICMASGLEYWQVKHYADNAVAQRHDGDEPTWGYKRYQTSYSGMDKSEMHSTIHDLSRGIYFPFREWIYVPHKTTFKKDNLPALCIVEQATHWVAVKDGAIWDTWDSRGKRVKKVVGVFCHRDQWREYYLNSK